MGSSREVRARISHPVIDCDAHMVEFMPPIEDYVRDIGGTSLQVDYVAPFAYGTRDSLSDRRRNGSARPPWWATPTANTLDRATSALPKLLNQRMDDFGIDFMVLFLTGRGDGVNDGAIIRRKGETGNGARGFGDPELLHVFFRAMNTYRADICREFSSRMTPVALVPMTTPEAAIDELEFVVNTLGLKAVTVSMVRRPVEAIAERHPELSPSRVFRLDTLGLDSEYDYDPFWAKCVELGVPIMSHDGSMGMPMRATPSNYVYNHIGHFADACETMCKSLFLGGVTRRFPNLRFAFLEGGVTWAGRLYADLVSHWRKRGRPGLPLIDPNRLDRSQFAELHERYGGEVIGRHLDRVLEGISVAPEPFPSYEEIDEYGACGIERAEDIKDLFVTPFFFGCEADDPTNALAFRSEIWPFEARLNAIFSSDIGHWDVPDASEVLEEAHELVERGLFTEGDFRDFTFTNPVKLFAGSNPAFFDGTPIESAARAVIAEPDVAVGTTALDSSPAS